MTSFLTSIVTSTSLFPPKDDFPPNRIRSKKSKIKNQHRFRALTFLIPILRKKSCQSGFSVANFSTLFKIWFFSPPLPSFGKKIKDPDFLIGTNLKKTHKERIIWDFFKDEGHFSSEIQKRSKTSSFLNLVLSRPWGDSCRLGLEPGQDWRCGAKYFIPHPNGIGCITWRYYYQGKQIIYTDVHVCVRVGGFTCLCYPYFCFKIG